MAIQYSKNPETSSWQTSENNLVFLFNDDTARLPLYCDVAIDGVVDIRLYPRPDGNFYFNGVDYTSALLSDYEDNLDLSVIDVNLLDTFIFNWGKVYLNKDVEFTINFEDTSQEVSLLNYSFLLAAEQIEDYQRGRTLKASAVNLLLPFTNFQGLPHSVDYWRGYPFDVAFTKAITGTGVTTIKNLTNATETVVISAPNDVNRLFFDDGAGKNLDNHLTLEQGFNNLEFFNGVNLNLNFIDNACGDTYLKWLNPSGSYSYFLFKSSSRELATVLKGVMQNDYDNIEATESQNKSLGRLANETLTVFVDGLTDQQIDNLKTIALSPKVLLYLGEPNTPPQGLGWLEVALDNKAIVTSDFKNRVPEISLNLRLPNYYTIKL
jgi:hypothetical protein